MNGIFKMAMILSTFLWVGVQDKSKDSIAFYIGEPERIIESKEGRKVLCFMSASLLYPAILPYSLDHILHYNRLRETILPVLISCC